MTNQSTTTNNTHNLNATEETKMTKTITHGTCRAEMTYHNDYIEVRNSDGAFLGNIYSADPAEDWEKIANGACPICDGWEDGLGHACTAYGWELEDPNFAAGHGVANLVEGGWKYEDRDELKAEFGLSDFEADAYAQAIFELWEANVEKKYLVSMEREDLIVTEVFDTLEEANDCASREWDHLSEHDKKSQSISVLYVEKTEKYFMPEDLADDQFEWSVWTNADTPEGAVKY